MWNLQIQKRPLHHRLQRRREDGDEEVLGLLRDVTSPPQSEIQKPGLSGLETSMPRKEKAKPTKAMSSLRERVHEVELRAPRKHIQSTPILSLHFFCSRPGFLTCFDLKYQNTKKKADDDSANNNNNKEFFIVHHPAEGGSSGNGKFRESLLPLGKCSKEELQNPGCEICK